VLVEHGEICQFGGAATVFCLRERDIVGDRFERESQFGKNEKKPKSLKK